MSCACAVLVLATTLAAPCPGEIDFGIPDTALITCRDTLEGSYPTWHIGVQIWNDEPLWAFNCFFRWSDTDYRKGTLDINLDVIPDNFFALPWFEDSSDSLSVRISWASLTMQLLQPTTGATTVRFFSFTLRHRCEGLTTDCLFQQPPQCPAIEIELHSCLQQEGFTPVTNVAKDCGVFDFSWCSTTAVNPDVRNDMPVIHATLSQNQPNPFNSATSISFWLPRSMSAKLEILNILGQTVALPAEGICERSNHSYIWDGKDATGRNLPSGIYFYRLQTDGFTQTRKMVLLK